MLKLRISTRPEDLVPPAEELAIYERSVTNETTVVVTPGTSRSE